MPTERLKQALRETNVAGVERDFVEVLARMFDLPAAAVARVVYAIESVKHPVTWHLGQDRAAELIPDPVLRDAIRKGANAGAARVHLRRLQIEGRQVWVPTKELVSQDEPGQICEGCKHSLTCAVESRSTPESCLNDLKLGVRSHVNGKQKVTLLRVTPDGMVRVRAGQPMGEHDVPVEIVEY
jgi:hypothetical protein